MSCLEGLDTLRAHSWCSQAQVAHSPVFVQGNQDCCSLFFCVKLNQPHWNWLRFKNMIKILSRRGERGSEAFWINEICAEVGVHDHFWWPSVGTIYVLARHPLPIGAGEEFSQRLTTLPPQLAQPLQFGPSICITELCAEPQEGKENEMCF